MVQLTKGKDKEKKLECVFSFDHQYPATKIMWAPDWGSTYEDLIVTVGDHLKVWRVEDNKKAELKSSLVPVELLFNRSRSRNLVLLRLRSIGAKITSAR